MATTTIYVADNRRGSINAGVGFTDWDELLGETEGDDLTTGSITQNSFQLVLLLLWEEEALNID
tara:strand:+ start:538 stop:729 length:192 start_codon:yes stop_codon:yes gene_type:complete